MSRTYEILLSSLLSDFGAILCRAGVGEGSQNRHAVTYFENRLPHNVIEAIASQGEADCANNAMGDIVHAAIRIALGHDTHTPEPDSPLESIFNRLNGGQRRGSFSADWYEASVQYPKPNVRNSESAYRRVLERWEESTTDALFTPPCANALIEHMERCFSYVPAAACDGDRLDVSLYHQSKAVAAIGCCLERWMAAQGIEDVREALSEAQKPFLLCSLDLSGIQTFIYTISSKGALKGLRVRSFYLSMLMEHISDTILEVCQLCRANLIYSGGGRAQLLLPNDGESLRRAREVVDTANIFLRQHFGASLFLASAYVEASAESVAHGFPDLFRAASRAISRQKLCRYDAETLTELNRWDARRASDRECVICGQSGRLQPHGDDEMVCETCFALEQFSNTLTENDLLLAVAKTETEKAIPLPGGLWLARADACAEDAVLRTYCVNAQLVPRPGCVWLHIGNTQANKDDGAAMTFEELADASAGVKRLGVLRADVDNLGMLFAAGLTDPGASQPHRFETLPRYMALSAAMTAFFQREINAIVAQGSASWVPDAEPSEQRRVSIVYSGGDDVFLVGAWHETLDAGLALQQAFHRYTGGGVTLSAGLGLFTPHEPVGIMAEVTAELEENAKLIEDGKKNAVALFAPVTSPNEAPMVFHWDALREDIIGKKVQLLCEVFKDNFSEAQAMGNAFLYQALTLLRDIGQKQIAIARLAYLLARHAPPKPNAPEKDEKAQSERYDAFSKQIYHWALNPDENRALQAAILLHVYAHRGEDERDE